MPTVKKTSTPNGSTATKAQVSNELTDKALDQVSGGLFFNPQPDPPANHRR